MNDEEYMEIAYQEALKALEYDDVPIGCIIVKDDEIIAKAYNQREHLNQTYGHAEMLAIEKACQKIGRWRLDECTLYTTLEPCLMCSGAIIQSHGSVHGLTTAACIWVMAVVGLAAGAGMFLAASITTAFTLFVLVSLERLERRMYLDGVNKILTINCSTSTPDLKGIRKILENRSIFIVSLSYEHNYDKNTSTITYKVNVKSKSSYSELFTEIRKLGYISQIRLLA